MTVIVIDARRMKTKEAAHEYLSRKPGFPPEYGKNLDALFDVLTSLAGCVIRIRYPKSIQKNLGEYGARLLQVMDDAAKQNENIKIEKVL